MISILFILIGMVQTLNQSYNCSQENITFTGTEMDLSDSSFPNCTYLTYTNMHIQTFIYLLNLSFPLTVQNMNFEGATLDISAASVNIINLYASQQLPSSQPGINIQTDDVLAVNSIDASEYNVFLVAKQLTMPTFLQAYTLAIYSFEQITLENSLINMSHRMCQENQHYQYGQAILEDIFNYSIFQQFSQDPAHLLNKLLDLNFTSILMTPQNLSISNSAIYGSQMLLVSNNTDLMQGSIISMDGLGCLINNGIGKGPLFMSDNYSCTCGGNGGSSAGYGGIGMTLLNQSDPCGCQSYTNITRYLFKLYPYGYLKGPIYQGSGGSILDPNPEVSGGEGGGALIMNAFNYLTINGIVSANGNGGLNGKSSHGNIQNQSVTGGGGGGGQLNFLFRGFGGSGLIQANGGSSYQGQNESISSGEGSGGFIRFINTSFNNNLSSYFTGNVSVQPGYRNYTSDLFKFKHQIMAQSGSKNILGEIIYIQAIVQPWCPPFYQINNSLQCEQCPSQTYKLWYDGQCVQCPVKNNIQNNKYFVKGLQNAGSSKNSKNSYYHDVPKYEIQTFCNYTNTSFSALEIISNTIVQASKTS